MQPRAWHHPNSVRVAVTVAAVLLIPSLSTGCATRGRPRGDPGAARDSASAKGRATSRFVFDPTNPALGLPPGTELRPPTPMQENRMPEYPAAALAAGAGGHAGLRFVVGPKGDVETIGPSPLVPEMEGPFADAFRGSAEAAVGTWKFEPAVLIQTEEGNDLDGDGKPDYRRATSLDLVPTYLDVRFDFEIVRGRGEVRVAGPAAR